VRGDGLASNSQSEDRWLDRIAKPVGK